MPPLSCFRRTCLALAISQTLTLPINAATIEVEVTGDSSASNNDCTLREAVVTVNNGTDTSNQINAAGCYVNGILGQADTITFNNNLLGSTITLAQSSDLVIDNASVDLTIEGLGQDSLTIDGGGNSRVFYISFATVSINSLTISGGSTSGNGGGIFAYSSSVSLANSTVSNNSASTSGGGIFAWLSSVSLANSIISGNTAGTGAEIYNNSSTLTAAHNNLFGHSSLTPGEAFTNFTPGITDINATSVDDNVSTHLPTALSSILSSLADNGCQQLAGAPSTAACVQTHALVSGSPAIDGADEAVCLSTDQRGKPRKDGMMMSIQTMTGKFAVFHLGDDYCDIGSVEFSSGD